MNLFSKIKNKTRLITINFIENILVSVRTGRKTENILLLKLDAIGDYILFRNFIEELHKANKNCKITLCGNILWKDLAENLDGIFIHKFIWVKVSDLNKFRYRYSIYKKLRNTNSKTLIHPTYSRTDNSDKLALASGAKTIIGYDGDTVNMGQTTKLANNQKYNRLIPSSQEEMFEFYRYRHFFEELLQKKFTFNRPYITSKKTGSENTQRSIFIFPGAGHENKRWPISSFKELCNSLYLEYKLPFIICGSKGDAPLAEELTKDATFPNKNIVGEKNLYELIEPLSQAALVIANDSGPFHLAAAVSANTVCIFKGNHFGRFCPYPREIGKGLIFIYPDEAKNNLADPTKRKLMYFEGLETDLSTISVKTVFDQIKNSSLLN